MSHKKTDDEPLFFLVAGEASGDLLGARLIEALKKKTDGHARFVGVGGPRMIEAGIEPLFPQSDLAHMGLFELIRHLPLILRRIRQTREAVLALRPAALITIDSPDFCFRVARKLKGQGIPLIHYVAPTVWAWRPGRAKKVAAFLDHLLALLPFEPPYFTKEGLDCTFVGHPLVESGAGRGNADRFREQHAVPEDAQLLTLLPGSRVGEISRLLPIFKQVVQRLHARHRSLSLVVPTVPHVKECVMKEVSGWGVPVFFAHNDEDKYDGFAASRVALACSGTVSVELALAALPSVIAYRIGALTAFLYRRLIKTRFATLANIMKGEEIMPEFIQEKCTAENLERAVEVLLNDAQAGEKQKKELVSLGSWLGKDSFVPSEKAADTVLHCVASYKGKKP